MGTINSTNTVLAGREGEQARGHRFGTFKGVFTPSILTILGVIMYLRMGWVLGHVGLPLTLLIVTMSSAITFLTGLSLSATATNMKVGGGGAYYIISRSLGVEVGTAIGVPLFLAQALSIAFYISGFAEAFVTMVDFAPLMAWLPFGISPVRLVAIVTLIILTVLAYTSADLALKMQMLILAAIACSLVSFFMGSGPETRALPTAGPAHESLAFWTVFAIFFPAVTGILAGVAMSGDLKDPSKALPRGTMAAVLTGYAVYVAIPVMLALVAPDEETLRNHPMIMWDVARWRAPLYLGVWAATLSSALGSLLGAPRTMQALARDRALPRSLGKGYGLTNEPRNATAISFVVALVAILLGDLNIIAPILTMFFLTAYSLINLSAGLEAAIESPSWRPQFRFPWWISLLGALACAWTMLMINPGATFLAWVVAGTIYALMKRRNLRAHWGDVRQGLLMLLVRVAIRHLLRRPVDERNWRPNILVFSGSPHTRWYLIELAHALARGPSYLTVATIMPTDAWTNERVSSIKRTVTDYLLRRNVHAMVKVFPAENVLQGAESLIKGYGFGPLEPNTVLIGETERDENVALFTSVIRIAHRLGRNLVLVREGGAPPTLPKAPRLDLWWRGAQSNIGLMIVLATQLKKSAPWTNGRIVLKRVVNDETERDEVERRLTAFLAHQRLDIEVELHARQQRRVFEIIHDDSQDASLVFLGMREPGDQTAEEYAAYYRKLIAATEGLPMVLVLSADHVDFQQIIGLG